MNTKPLALILCLTHLNKDPRVLRQIFWLRDRYHITTLGRSPSGIENVDHVQYDDGPSSPLPSKLGRAVTYFTGNYDSFYWNSNRRSYVDKLKEKKFSLIVANDVDTLPMGVAIKEAQETKLVFDAHEYSPLEFT